MKISSLYPVKIITGSLILLFATAFALTGCDSNDDEDDFNGNMVVYELDSANDDGISGFVSFEEMADGSTFVVIDLSGTVAGESYAAHIHDNSVSAGGPIAIPLTNVDGSTGTSETTIEAEQMTFTELLNFDGHVNVHDPDDLAIIVAQGNIGANADNGADNGNNNGNGDDGY